MIADIEIEADKILLFDEEFLTWGLVTLQAYKNDENGEAIEYDDKKLNMNDTAQVEEFKEYLAQIWPGIKYEDLVEDHD